MLLVKVSSLFCKNITTQYTVDLGAYLADEWIITVCSPSYDAPGAPWVSVIVL